MAELTAATVQGIAATLMALTSLVAGTRLVSGLRHTGLRGARWDDGWLLAGSVLFLAVGGVYAARAPEVVRLLNVQGHRARPYPGYEAERAAVRRVLFWTGPLIWLALWCVKFSLLALYRKIMIQSPAYARAWCAVNAFCIVALLGVIVLHIALICRSLASSRSASECVRRGSFQGPALVIWVSYSFDISTTLAVMILPIHLIGTLEMPRHIKLSLGFLFGLGVLVILAATAGLIQIGTSDSPCPSIAWLGLWRIIEISVGEASKLPVMASLADTWARTAIIVGSGPGLYRQGNGARPFRPANYYLTPGDTTITANSTRGKGSSVSRTRFSRPNDIPLSPYAYPVATVVHARRACSSEEQLVRGEGRGGITITKSVKMESEIELSPPGEAILGNRNMLG